MKKIFLIMMICSLITAPAWAINISFGDNSIYWPGYAAKPADDMTYYWGSKYADNSRDSISNPQLIGGIASFNAQGQLVSISISGSGYSNVAGGIAPGDLFLGNSTSWNYVIQTYPGTMHNDAAPGQKNVYTGQIPLNGGANTYLMTGADNTGTWTGENIRNDHPIALGSTTGLSWFETALYSGFNGDNGLTTWTFSTPISITGDQLYIGWTVSCANDVIYEYVSVPQVPEPSTLLLLGLGLVGAVVIRKKLKK